MQPAPLDASANVYRQSLEQIGCILSFSRGVSMLPLIREKRGYVQVGKVDEPQIDDILLFEDTRNGEKVNILHRLVEITPDGTYITRGDNCLRCERIKREQIIGRAERIFWTKDASRTLPRLLGAEPDENGGYKISVESVGYLRYVRIWNALWPVRRLCYRARGNHLVRTAMHRLKRLPYFLSHPAKLYHRIIHGPKH